MPCFLGGQPFGQLQDFVDFGRTEHATDALRVDNREGGVDQVFLFHLFTLDDEILQQVEEFELPAGQSGVGANELIECGAHLIGEAFEYLNAENVPDELDEVCLAISIDLTQQVFGDVRMFLVQQVCQFSFLVGSVWTMT